MGEDLYGRSLQIIGSPSDSEKLFINNAI